ncbi:MAG: phosphogluconate dehydrogenase (NAD(+)-dependent, decarboxylating) [Candidatus Promineifilaceae bacterium]
MEIAMVGLGKMGANMATRLLRDGHRVIVTDLNEEAIVKLETEEGAIGARSLDEVAAKFQGSPRAVWVMVPAGGATEGVIKGLSNILEPGDIIIDGGNSNYENTQRRAEELAAKEIEMLDCGTSGGIWGLAEGYSMMVGGGDASVAHITPALKTLAPGHDKGWGHVGPNGAGHFVKMVHNGIEYGMMQAYAEGFDIMRAKTSLDLDLHHVAQIWQHGSVVRSWLLDLTANALSGDQDLSDIDGYVPDSGEGRWTVMNAIDLNVPAPVITLALQMRFASRDSNKYWARMLAAMRNQFGGHAVRPSSD